MDTEKYTIQPAVQGNTLLIGRITDKYSTELGWVLHSEIRDAIKADSAFICVHKETQDIVGYILFRTRKRDKITRVYSIAVLPDHTRQGIAKELLKRCPRPLILSCPESATNAKLFYEANGLEFTGIIQGRKQKLLQFKDDGEQ